MLFLPRVWPVWLGARDGPMFPRLGSVVSDVLASWLAAGPLVSAGARLGHSAARTLLAIYGHGLVD